MQQQQQQQTKIIILGALGALLMFMVFSYFRNYVNKPIAHKHKADKQWPTNNAPLLEDIFKTAPDIAKHEGVVQFHFPCTTKIAVNGYHLKPFMGTQSWVSFQKGLKPGVEAMMMGNIVLLEHEVNPAIATALEHNIDITSLNNHYFSDNPVMYFMHINAEGNLQDIAKGIQHIRETTANKSLMAKQPAPVTNTINAQPLQEILGKKGTEQDGMFKVIFGRDAQAGCGCPIGKSMGVKSWAAFGGTNDNAIINGDLVAFESEVQGVIRALQQAGMLITSLHNHMLQEKPNLIFIHFWGQGKAADLAQGFKTALETTGCSLNKEKKKHSHSHKCDHCH